MPAASPPSRLSRYLADLDVWHAALVSVLALALSGGLVFVGYLTHVLRLLLESAYLMWIDLGVRWATLIGHTRMASRIG